MLATTVDGREVLASESASPFLGEKDLPGVIVRAIARTMTSRLSAFAKLGLQERAMLVEILRCTPKDRPSNDLFVRRDTLAIRLSCSLATVTRVLARLESQGWITRDQVKSRIRGFQVGSLTFTRGALLWLGFETDTPTAQRCSPMTDACSSFSKQSLQRQLQHADGYVDKSTQNAKTNPTVKLPANLEWLTKHVTPFGVCKLMKEARRKGVLLEDLTTQCEAQIQKADNGFAYIKKLLGIDRDWAFERVQERAENAKHESEGEQRRVLESRMAEIDGRDFVGSDGFVRKVRGGIATLFCRDEATKVLGRSRGVLTVGEAFFDAIRDGRLTPWPTVSSSSEMVTFAAEVQC